MIAVSSGMAERDPYLPDPISGLCVVIQTDDPDHAMRARTLASDYNAPVFDHIPESDEFGLALVQTNERAELHVLSGDKSIVGGHPIYCDLTAIDTESGPGRSLKQPLIKAVGIKKGSHYRPTVLDATVGLGEDTWILASLGCKVTGYERQPLTLYLLKNGLRRARQTRPDIAKRITVLPGNALDILRESANETHNNPVDVVYLDPMFPLGRKTAERKAMRVLRMYSGDDTDADDLLAGALTSASKRVVVKRPLRSPALAGPQPTVVHKGKSLRFDVYVTGASR